MKQRIFQLTMGLMILLLVAGCGKGGTDGKTQYHCPMHPTIVQDKKGTCPVCFMDLVPIGDQHAATPAAQHAAPEYQCPMHPTIIADKPGDCPICGTKLVPMKTASDAHTSTVPGQATVAITPEVRQRMGLTLGLVEKRNLTREIRTSARIVADETRLSRVTTKNEGWVEKLFVNVTGQQVKKGDPLLTVYSPELVSAQEEFLLATDSLKKASRRRLELWDISDAQIAQLEKAGKAEKNLTLYAPAAGVVLERMVLPGQKIMPNEPLLIVGDLSVVWADADIYQSDLPFVKEGMPVTVTVSDKTFTGQVTFITPTLDPATRTMRARLEIPNPELFLKPEMYATARLTSPLGEMLAIPETAVMRTGDHTYAFKGGGEGKLIPVAIQIGARSAGYFAVVAGLQEGDRVVTSANFLVDSESSLKAALAAMTTGTAGQITESNAVVEDPHAGHRR